MHIYLIYQYQLIFCQVSREFCIHTPVHVQWSAAGAEMNTLESSGTFLWIAKYSRKLKERAYMPTMFCVVYILV